MKERPIIFSTPMLRAILDGRKTQTRRIAKSIPPDAVKVWHDGSEWIAENADGNCWNPKITCPYGKPGGHLWVRETWGKFGDTTFFKADHPDNNDVPWRPSIHMPRIASRITLEVTGIRAERVKGITEDDAIAEGVEVIGSNRVLNPVYRDYSGGLQHMGYSSAQASFRSLWQHIHGPASWDYNPWVWVITFRQKP